MKERLEALDWHGVEGELGTQGSALIEQLLTPAECGTLAALYPAAERFRGRVVMNS